MRKIAVIFYGRLVGRKHQLKTFTGAFEQICDEAHKWCPLISTCDIKNSFFDAVCRDSKVTWISQDLGFKVASISELQPDDEISEPFYNSPLRSR